MRNFIILIVSVLLFAMSSCNDNVIDYSNYTDELCIDGTDSILMFAENPEMGNRTIYLNIHCTASKEGKDIKGDWFLDFFKNNKKWSKPGYNEIIEMDGNRFLAVPYNLDGYTTWDEVSYGVGGKNSVSINIAYVGGVDNNLNSKDTRTTAQKRAIDKVVYEIRCAMPHIIVMGHNNHEGVKKSCPSFNVQKEYGKLNPFLNHTKEFDYEPSYSKDSML